MTRFTIGLLLGLLTGIAGTAAFLITAQGGDYLIVSSPRVRELEATLRRSEEEREWMRSRLRESNDLLARLEGRFETLAARFEDLGQKAAADLRSPPDAPAKPENESAAAVPLPTPLPAPAEERAGGE